MSSGSKKITPLFNDYLYGAIRRIATEQGFTPDLFSVDFDEESCIECNGFVSFVFKAIINGDDRELVLWCKVPPNDDQRSMDLFRREVHFYREILPAFYRFQKEKGISEDSDEGFFSAPKCYLAHCDTDKAEPEAAIVLAYDESYERWDWDKLEPINVEHAKLLMRQLGRLHAITFALKEQKPEVFEQFKLKDVLVPNSDLVSLMKESFDRALVTMRTRFAAEQEQIQRIKEAVFQMLTACADPVKSEPYCVVSHGDCWINNLIYGHDENNVATSLTFTDWQSSRYASPLLDLGYFFFLCTGAQFRKDHLDDLLQHYHSSVKDLLDRLGEDTARQFPLTNLHRLMKPFRELLLGDC
ncbi:uncharacterized protein LOC131681605 [Topomyia yanbarensis]|uniref:uncharacterized protein LOC131681605 n=1 Tax=Topomyia yanbarensis TaxID=2498891 RepID=UPI00273C1F91|nr:uncharacterized protein LOC131681605 [Topomyia yanbarensis]